MRFLPCVWYPIDPRRLFLLDSLGAALSVIGLGLILPAFEHAVGVPARVLYPLALLASGLAACSLRCFWRPPSHWRRWLTGIARANLLYCGLTAGLLLGYAPTLTGWGAAYFGLEMTVIILLACWELQTAARPSSSQNL